MSEQNKNILIVDDEADIRELLSELLVDQGKLFCAENGSHALQLLEEVRFDVVISDYNMPGLNGLQLLQSIRERKCMVPLIWITGNSTTELMTEAKRVGVFDYLEKPFDIEQVKNQVQAALNLSASELLQLGTRASADKGQHSELLLELEFKTFEALKLAALRQGLSITTFVTNLIRDELKIEKEKQ